MRRLYYILPADFCAYAVSLFLIAKADAVSANSDLETEYGCSGMVRSGIIGVGLAYRHAANVNGFGSPTKIADGFWLTKPDRNSVVGRVAQNKLDDCADLLELLTWSLEKCLGVFGMVAQGDATHFVVAKLLNDGRVMISVPQGDWLALDHFGQALDAPVIPPEALLIDESEAKQILSTFLAPDKANA